MLIALIVYVVLLSKQEFAKPLGITISCVNRWLLEGKIARVKVGRLVRIPEEELDRIVTEGYRPAKPSKARTAQ